MSLKLLSNMDEIAKTMQSIREKLIPNLFVVFFVAYKPVKKMLAKRADHIEEEIAQAEQNHALALQETSQAKQILADSKVQASEIIARATQEGQAKYEAMMVEAEEAAREMKEAAVKDIERAKEDALQDIRNEMVSVALTASKEILKREVDSADNTRLAEDFINQLN